MKKHWFSMVKYILGFILLLFLIFTYKQNYLIFLLFPYVLLPLISIPFFLRSIKEIKINAQCLSAFVSPGNPVMVKINIENPTYCPLFGCRVYFKAENLFYPNEFENMVNIVAMPQKGGNVVVPVDTLKAGMMSFSLTKVEFKDFLNFFSITKPLEDLVQIPIIPSGKVNITIPETPSSEGLDEYSEPNLKGNISSDVKEIREYRPGDRLTRIHWKLSAKLDDLFVKEMEHTSILSIVVLPEMTASNIDDTILCLKNVIDELCKREERFEVCLFNNKTYEFKYLVIDGEESIYDCYVNLFYLPLYDGENIASDYYFRSGQKSGVIVSLQGKSVHLLADGEEFIV